MEQLIKTGFKNVVLSPGLRSKGAQYVLVADGKVYKLRNHDADLKDQAGHTVNLTGDLTGDTIRVSKITMSTSAK